LVGPLDLEQMFVLVHIDCDKLVADFGGVLGCIDKTELLGIHLLEHLGTLIEIDGLGLDFLVPSDLVQTLAEEDHIS